MGSVPYHKAGHRLPPPKEQADRYCPAHTEERAELAAARDVATRRAILQNLPPERLAENVEKIISTAEKCYNHDEPRIALGAAKLGLSVVKTALDAAKVDAHQTTNATQINIFAQAAPEIPEHLRADQQAFAALLGEPQAISDEELAARREIEAKHGEKDDESWH